MLNKDAERIKIMLDTSPLACRLWDDSFELLDCNDETVRLFGLNNKQEYEQRYYDLMPEFQPDGQRSREKVAKMQAETVQKGRLVFEWMHQKLDGTPLPVEITLVRVDYEDSYIIAGYTRDLRELKETDAKRREADQQMQIMFDATPLGANLWNRDIQNIKTNDEAVKLFGLSSKQEYLEKFHRLSPERQADGRLSSEKAIELVRRAFDEGYLQFEWMHQKLDGEQIPCEITLIRIKDKEDYVVAGYTRDLREAKAALAANQKAIDAKNVIDYLSSILNSLEVMVCVTDPKTLELLFINDSMKQHFGVDGEGIGQVCYQAIHKRNEVCVYCPIAQLEKEPDKIITWEESNAVTGHIYRNVDRCIYWPDGRPVYMRHSVDITELINAKESAEQSNRSKDVFLAHMSHEIRTPMNAILGISEIQLYDKTLSAETKEGFVRIYESGNLLLNIINDILDLSKIDADKLEIVSTQYSLPSLIVDTAQLNHLRFEDKPIEFVLRVDETVPLELIGDELRIKQILNNLLSNAFKYTEAGEVTMSVSAEAGPDRETVTLIFQVRDTGQGMRKDQINRLFDAYSRFNLETNRDITGTGLGMNITKRLIDLMNGEIWVDSIVNSGSAFTVRLPQQSCGADICGADIAESLQNFNYRNTSISKKAQIKHEYMPYGKVLIADDMESNLYVAKGLLIPYGLRIETVTNGLDAVEKIKNGEHYDVIFMDHMMPKMNGIQATRMIRDFGFTYPIVALTANAVVGQAEMFLSKGFNGFLSKPIDSHELDQVLKTMIRDKQPPEIIEAARRQQVRAADKNRTVSPKIDIAVFQKFFMRDAEHAIRVLKALNAKTDALDDADMKAYMITVHGIRSALSNIGASALSEFALRLERAGSQGKLDVITDETPAFIEALQSLTDKL